MENNKVSVVVPVYNSRNCLERCVISLLEQTYSNMEVLLIDDGSDDGSGELCDTLANSYQKISVYHIDNGGVSRARNLGIEKSSGEYLTFVDADDCLRKPVIEQLVFAVEKHESGFAGCQFLSFDRELPPESEEEFQTEKIKTQNLSAEEFVEMGILGGDTRCWSKLYRREAIGETRFQEGLTIGEDMLFLLTLAIKQTRISRLDYPGYCYYNNQSGAMNRSFVPAFMDQILCWRLAEACILPVFPRLKPRTASIRMVSAMLVVGKLSRLAKGARVSNAEYVAACRAELREGFKVKGAYHLLSRKYRIKVLFFILSPGLYLRLYGEGQRLWGE